MKAKEIREKESPVLEQEVRDKQRHLFDLRSQAVTEKLEDPTQLGKTRREIAQIKTILHQRALDEKRKAETAGNDKAQQQEKLAADRAAKKAAKQERLAKWKTKTATTATAGTSAAK